MQDYPARRNDQRDGRYEDDEQMGDWYNGGSRGPQGGNYGGYGYGQQRDGGGDRHAAAQRGPSHDEANMRRAGAQAGAQRWGGDGAYDPGHRVSGVQQQEPHYGGRDADDWHRQSAAQSQNFRPVQRGGTYGGYGGLTDQGRGFNGGQRAGGQHDSEFDPDYHQWREEQMRSLDDDYRSWRGERYKKFSEEFDGWRKSRTQSATGNGAANGAEAAKGPSGNEPTSPKAK